MAGAGALVDGMLLSGGGRGRGVEVEVGEEEVVAGGLMVGRAGDGRKLGSNKSPLYSTEHAWYVEEDCRAEQPAARREDSEEEEEEEEGMEALFDHELLSAFSTPPPSTPRPAHSPSLAELPIAVGDPGVPAGRPCEGLRARLREHRRRKDLAAAVNFTTLQMRGQLTTSRVDLRTMALCIPGGNTLFRPVGHSSLLGAQKGLGRRRGYTATVQLPARRGSKRKITATVQTNGKVVLQGGRNYAECVHASKKLVARLRRTSGPSRGGVVDNPQCLDMLPRLVMEMARADFDAKVHLNLKLVVPLLRRLGMQVEYDQSGEIGLKGALTAKPTKASTVVLTWSGKGRVLLAGGGERPSAEVMAEMEAAKEAVLRPVWDNLKLVADMRS